MTSGSPFSRIFGVPKFTEGSLCLPADSRSPRGVSDWQPLAVSIRQVKWLVVVMLYDPDILTRADLRDWMSAAPLPSSVLF